MMKKRSLKMVMLTYAITVLVFMALVVAAFLYYHYYTTREYLMSSYEGLGVHVQAQFKSAVSSIQKTAADASYSSAVQNCTFTKDPMEYFSFRSSAQTTLDLLNNNTQYADGLFIISDTNRTIFNTAASIYTFRKAWGYSGDGFDALGRERGFLIKNVDTPSQQLWYCAPVYYSTSNYFDITRKGYCAVLCDLSPLTQSLDAGTGFDSGIAILHRGSIISSNRPLTPGERAILSDIQSDAVQAAPEVSGYLIKAVELSLPDWQLVFITPERSITAQAMQFGTGSLLALIVLILITLAFVTVVFFMTTNPVRRMLSEMNQLQGTNWSGRLTDSRIAEFSELVGGINATLDSMLRAYRLESETRERLHQSELAQSKAKLDAYRMQINSHFLFNTLECMRSMASVYGAEPVEEIIESLSFMFRYTYNAADIVPLREEIAHVEHYVRVMNMRYPGRFRLRVQLEDARLAEFLVCSMVLQPLAENSIRHGFAKKAPPASMMLQCMLQGDGSVLVRFSDNGSGIEPERLCSIREELACVSDAPKRGAIGLTNINRRLRLAGMSDGLEIASRPGRYTSVCFKLEASSPDLRAASGETP